jgi:Tfp pilus assembly protein PilF
LTDIDLELGLIDEDDHVKKDLERELEDLSNELDMDIVKDLMFGKKEGDKSDDEESFDDENHISELKMELSPSAEADRIRKEAYGDPGTSSDGPSFENALGDEAPSSVAEGDDPLQPPDKRKVVARKVMVKRVRMVKEEDPEKLKIKERKEKFLQASKSYLAKRDTENAKKILFSALREFPLDEEFLYDLGNVFFMEGNLESARSRYSKAIEVDPTSFRSHNNLGVVLKRMGEKEMAIREFNRALEINDKYEKAWLNLGTIFMEIEPPLINEARVFLKRALDCDPSLEAAKEKLDQLANMEKSGS